MTDYPEKSPEQVVGRRSIQKDRTGPNTTPYDPFAIKESYGTTRNNIIQITDTAELNNSGIRSGWVQFLNDAPGFYLSAELVKQVANDVEDIMESLFVGEHPSYQTLVSAAKFLKSVSEMLKPKEVNEDGEA